MSGWDGVRERVLALGPRQRRGRLGWLGWLSGRSAAPCAPLLDDPLTEDQVAAAERQFGIVFPAEYRGFLLAVGAGGFGPGYGLNSLEFAGGRWGWRGWSREDDRAGVLLARPFPSEEQRARWARQLDELRSAAVAAGGERAEGHEPYAVSALRAAEDELYPAMTAGAVCLNDEGCGDVTWLVVTGGERGTVWSDQRYADGPLVPLTPRDLPASRAASGDLPGLGRRGRTRTGFAEWYMAWLEKTTREHRDRSAGAAEAARATRRR